MSLGQSIPFPSIVEVSQTWFQPLQIVWTTPKNRFDEPNFGSLNTATVYAPVQSITIFLEFVNKIQWKTRFNTITRVGKMSPYQLYRRDIWARKLKVWPFTWQSLNNHFTLRYKFKPIWIAPINLKARISTRILCPSLRTFKIRDNSSPCVSPKQWYFVSYGVVFISSRFFRILYSCGYFCFLLFQKHQFDVALPWWKISLMERYV